MAVRTRSADDSDDASRSVRRESIATLGLSSVPRQINVGKAEESKPFYIHDRILAKHSAHFAARIETEVPPGVKDEAEGIIIKADEDCKSEVSVKRLHSRDLPDEDPDIFDLFSTFVYSGHVGSERGGDLEDEEANRDAEWGRLARAWVLGRNIESTAFMDAVADAFVARLQRDGSPGYLFTDFIEASPEGSPIRQLQADIVTYGMEPETYSEAFKQTEDVDFLRTLATTLGLHQKVSKAEAKGYFGQCGCRYHSHVESNKPCYKTMF
ncbi:hypothetical protein B0A48_08507 [Cryoendolithus antarcticus]|uniref:BTB domain-containing protein n=1 Tax=Cryoendolithus antarcticus TaxID=1507870 RepID=A0A1V8T5V5_9PEZI|nr:hypothetical protein B0A48_08507 [Cryoendolithus antarcticus]